MTQPNIEIVDSVGKHAKELAKTLRIKDRIEAESMGLNPEQATFYAYRWALWKRTALVDGKVAAMWGLHGSLLGHSARPYLITGEAVNLVSPIKFARVYTKEVQIMKQMFPVLENYVDLKYEESVRMLRIAGFTIKEPELLNGHLFSKFEMRSE